MGVFKTHLRRSGYKITAPREAVLAVLENEKGHLHPSDILLKARAIHAGVGRATVYRTLDILKMLNLVRPIYINEAGPSYMRVAGGHHHLVCSNCGKVVEFDACNAGDLQRKLARKHRFVIQSHLLEFYGQCEDCRN